MTSPYSIAIIQQPSLPLLPSQPSLPPPPSLPPLHGGLGPTPRGGPQSSLNGSISGHEKVGGKKRHPKSPPHLLKRHLAAIHEAKRLAAEFDPEVQVFDQPANAEAVPPLTSAADRTSTGLTSLYGWFKSLFAQPPASVDDPDRAKKRAEQEKKTGREQHVLIMQQEYKTQSGRTVDETYYKGALEQQFGADKVHVVPKPPQAYLFPRNLFESRSEGGVVTTSEVANDERIIATHRALMEYFRAKGIPVEVIPGYINFSDVDLVDSNTLIIGTRDDQLKRPLDPETLKELQRVLGNPSHVLRVRLDPKNPACYDLDVPLHATISATTHELVFLFYEPCFVAGTKKGELGPVELRAELVARGEVIDISEEDLWNLAANSVTNPNEPGRFLMTRPISEKLYRALVQAGATPDFPGGNIPVGFNGRNQISIYGYHCLTLNFHLPTRSQDEKEGL